MGRRRLPQALRRARRHPRHRLGNRPTRPGTRGFTPIPKRWTVERTYGWLMLHRRLARDYETLPARSEAMIHLAMTDLMARRLTGENTNSWRDPTSPDQLRIPG
ncbi:transposase [Streptomyces sp. DSM 41640]|uniref:Transposase n=1 Tax=Streptomyces doebereineriae TaxID=3075528 RepID=A0ABU2VG47_9ACTN|nr:transposase [Streptomyces sp. DSM 41640]MDT0484552.1 transposase [Streptomyces sp. DSM 41640]